MSIIFACECGSTVFVNDGGWLYCAKCPTKRTKIVARCTSNEFPDNTEFCTIFDAKKSLNNHDVRLVWEQAPKGTTYQQVVDALKHNNDDIVDAVMEFVKEHNNYMHNIDVEVVLNEVPTATYQQAVDALKNNNGDVVDAVLELTTKHIDNIFPNCGINVETILKQVPKGTTYQQVVNALENNNGDVVDAILELTKKYDDDVDDMD